MHTNSSGLLRALGVALVAAALAACAGAPTKESTGELIDDTVITTKVKSKLVGDKEVSALDVQVETFKGTVQLSGFVGSERERERAAELARSVDGVKEVRNDLQLKRGG
jgi:osmotically-inducible protein OsmY